MTPRRLVAVVLLVVGMPALARAQSRNEAECAKVITETQADCTALETAKNSNATADVTRLRKKPLSGLCTPLAGLNAKSCDTLASALPPDVDTGSNSSDAKANRRSENEQLADKVTVEKQPDRQTSTNKGGSSGQTEVVESIQPITLAGGGLTLAGTRSGMKGVGTITVNPLALGRPNSVAAGRVFDLSVSAPFDLDGGTSEDQRYVSARLRVNVTGLYNTGDLQAAVDAFDKWLRSEGHYGDDLERVLQRAPNVRICAESILRTKQVAKAACGEDLSAEAVRTARDEAFKQIRKARRKADAHYFGLDARFDTGDPTGTEVDGDKGTHLMGGLAGGARIAVGPRFDWELRGRLAGDYFKSRDAAAPMNAKAVTSFDWGIAVIFSGRVQEADKQRLAFGFGLEGRHAPKTPEAEVAPTNYAMLNLMAVVPAVSGGDLGLAFSVPVADAKVERGVTISLSTDLGLLDHPGK